MSRVVVLGGSGAVGSVAVAGLAAHEACDEVVVADIDRARGREIAAELGSKVTAVRVDVLDRASLRDAIAGSDLVLNCSGPFYRLVKPIFEAVVEAGIDYIDICDDFDVTLELLDMDAEAKRAGITALIGMGSSPGVTNLLGKLAADALLDETDAIDIFHAHGGEPFEGAGVIEHRFHCMTVDIPMFLDGELKYVSYFDDDGIALRQTFNFPVLGEVLLYPYPHPEQITMPRHIDCRQVTNKGAVLPAPYYDLIKSMVALGLASKEPLNVLGSSVAPYHFSIAYIIRERDRILKAIDFGSQRGCVSVVAKGKRRGEYREYRFHMASRTQALGEGTGLPAAMGAILMLQGKVSGRGVLPPEACIEPQDFLALLPHVMTLDEKKEGGERFGGVIVEEVDEHGNIEKLDI